MPKNSRWNGPGPECGRDIRWEAGHSTGKPRMRVKRISLDTNILVYAMDRDAGDRHVRAMEILDQSFKKWLWRIMPVTLRQ